MRKLAVLVSVGMVFVGGCSPTNDGSSAAVEKGVRGLLSQYSQSVSDGEWDEVLALYAEDPRFIWVEDGRIAYESVNEIRNALESLQEQFTDAETEFVDPRITALGPGLGYVSTSVRQSFTGPEGDTFAFTALMTATVVQTELGWRFLTGHTSTERQDRPRGRNKGGVTSQRTTPRGIPFEIETVVPSADT